MEIIKTYLDNLFAGLPNTKEVSKIKADLLTNMVDKYEELKRNGKTENEAIGIVISEFGNIDELKKELGIDLTPKNGEDVPTVTEEVAVSYMDTMKKMSRYIALGVLLCILSPITLIILSGNLSQLKIAETVALFIGLVVLFLFVAPAVGIFIYAGMKIDKYQYLHKKVNIPSNVKELVESEKEKFDSKFVVALIVSIIMYIFSPTFIIGAALLKEENDAFIVWGVGLLLVIVSIATYIIVRFGLIRSSHSLLLRLGDYQYLDDQSEKLVNAIAGIYWPIVVGGYLLWSFLSSKWDITWIVFPIAGVIFAGITSIIRAVKKN